MAAQHVLVPFLGYYSPLRIRRKLRIIPIVLYLAPDAGGLVMETYREGVFGKNYLTFQYHAAGLPDLNAADYRERDEPLAISLPALRKASAVSAPERKRAAILAIARDKAINETQKEWLSTVVESYTRLQGSEAAEGSALDMASEALFEAESWGELREYFADPSLARD